MIAQSAMEIDAARLLTLRAAYMRDLGQDNTLEVSMAKLFGAQMAQRVTDWAIQVHGGDGVSRGIDRERGFCRAPVPGPFGGSDRNPQINLAAALPRPPAQR